MKTAYFMIGGPASGKTRARTRRFEHENVAIVDCDAIKESHVDYDPKQPELLHEWSKMEAMKSFNAQLAQDADFVYDSTGTNTEKMVFLMNAARAAGFQIAAIYVACDVQTALERNRNRKRTVPESIVREKYAMIATAFEIVSRYADSVETVRS